MFKNAEEELQFLNSRTSSGVPKNADEELAILNSQKRGAPVLSGPPSGALTLSGAPPIPSNPTLLGEFTSGVKRGVPQLASMFGGMAGLAGSAVGLEGVRDWGIEKAREYEAKAAAIPTAVPTLSDIDSVKEAGLWGASKLGEQIPILGETLLSVLAGMGLGSAAGPAGTVGGGATGLVGKQMVKHLIKQQTKELVAKGFAKEAAKKTATEMIGKLTGKAITRRIGALAGMGAGVLPLEAGGNYAEGMAKGIDDPWSALGTGAAATALEYAGGGARVLGKVMSPIERAVKSGILLNILKTGTRTIPEEFMQEVGQEFLSNVNLAMNDPSVSLTDKQSLLRYLESGAAGGLVGGVFGVAGGLAGKRSANLPEPKAEKKATATPPIPPIGGYTGAGPTMPTYPGGPLSMPTVDSAIKQRQLLNQQYMDKFFGVQPLTLAQRNQMEIDRLTALGQAEGENYPPGTQLDMFTGQPVPYYAQKPGGIGEPRPDLPIPMMQSPYQLDFDFGKTAPTLEKPVSIVPLTETERGTQLPNQFGVENETDLRRRMERMRLEESTGKRIEDITPEDIIAASLAEIMEQRGPANVYEEEGGKGIIPTPEEMRSRQYAGTMHGPQLPYVGWQMGLPGMLEAGQAVRQAPEITETRETEPVSEKQKELPFKKGIPKEKAAQGKFTQSIYDETTEGKKDLIPDFSRNIYTGDIRGPVEEEKIENVFKKQEDEVTELKQKAKDLRKEVYLEEKRYAEEREGEQFDLFEEPAYEERRPRQEWERITAEPRTIKQFDLIRKYNAAQREASRRAAGLDLLKRSKGIVPQVKEQEPLTMGRVSEEEKARIKSEREVPVTEIEKGEGTGAGSERYIQSNMERRLRESKEAEKAIARAREAKAPDSLINDMQAAIDTERYNAAVDIYDKFVLKGGKVRETPLARTFEAYKESLVEEHRPLADKVMRSLRSDGRVSMPNKPKELTADEYDELITDISELYQQEEAKREAVAERKERKEMGEAAEGILTIPDEALMRDNTLLADVLLDLLDKSRVKEADKAVTAYIGTLGKELKPYAKELKKAVVAEVRGREVTLPARPEGMTDAEYSAIYTQLKEAVETDIESGKAWEELLEEYTPEGVQKVRKALLDAGIRKDVVEDARLIILGQAMQQFVPYGIWEHKIKPAIVERWRSGDFNNIPREGLKKLRDLIEATGDKLIQSALDAAGVKEKKSSSSKAADAFLDALAAGMVEETSGETALDKILGTTEEVTTEAKPYEGLTPGTPEWKKVWKEHPELQEEMAEIAKQSGGKLIGYSLGRKVTRQKFISRSDLKNNPDKQYLFGDNLLGKGFGGQAQQMRGEPNAIGIPTKKKPAMTPDSFFTDAEFEANKKAIDNAFSKIDPNKEVVIPASGLGTGLAGLEQKAPKTFAYLQQKLAELEGGRAVEDKLLGYSVERSEIDRWARYLAGKDIGYGTWEGKLKNIKDTDVEGLVSFAGWLAEKGSPEEVVGRGMSYQERLNARRKLAKQAADFYYETGIDLSSIRDTRGRIVGNRIWIEDLMQAMKDTAKERTGTEIGAGDNLRKEIFRRNLSTKYAKLKDKLLGHVVDPNGILQPIDRSMPSNDTIRKVTDILNKVFEETIGKGGFELEFMDVNDMPIDMEKLKVDHGITDTDIGTIRARIGGQTFELSRGQFKYLVQLAYRDEPGMIRAGLHEIGEILHYGFLSDTDKAILEREFKGGGRHWKENFSDALAQYLFDRKIAAKNPGLVRRIFDKIENIFNRMKNALLGNGFRSYHDIFNEIMSGQYVSRHIRTVETSDNAANLLGYEVDEQFKDKSEAERDSKLKSEWEEYLAHAAEYKEKYFPDSGTGDIGWFAKHFGLAFYRARKYFQEGKNFKRIFDVFMSSMDIRDKEFRNLIDGTLSDYFSLSKEERKAVEEAYKYDDEFGFESGVDHNDKLKERGLSDKQLKAYWQVVGAMRKAKLLEIRTDVAGRLYHFRNRKWFEPYVDDWLFGKYRSWDSFIKHLHEYGMHDSDIADVENFEKSPETARFRERVVNRLNEETGKWEEKTMTLKEEVADLRRMANSGVYLPRERGDGKYYVRLIRVAADGKEMDTWGRWHTNWMPVDTVERFKHGRLIEQANKRRDELNAELKSRGIEDGSEFKVEHGMIRELPEELRLDQPESELIKIQKFLEFVTAKTKERAGREHTPFTVDPQSLDALTGSILDTTYRTLMSLSSRRQHEIQRDYFTDFDGQKRAIEGYQTEKINEVILRRLERAANYAGRRHASLRAYEALGNIDIHNYPELFSYSKKYIVDQLRGNTQVDRLVNMARASMFHLYLGFALRPTALQFTQNFVLGMGNLSRDINRGKGNRLLPVMNLKAEKYMLRAMKDISVSPKKHTNLSEIEQKAIHELLISGELEAQFTKMARGEMLRKTGSFMQKVIDMSSFLFSQAEIWNRKVIALARFRAGQEVLGETYEQSIEAAKDIINRTHFIYKGNINLPSFARGGTIPAAAGRAAITLRTYTMGFLETLIDSMKDAEGKVALDVVMRSLAYLMLIGGMASIPWLNDLMDRYERGIMGMGGYPVREEMKKLMGKEGGFTRTFLNTGLIGALAGTDISGSMRIGLPSLDAQGIEDMFLGVYGGLGDKFDNAVTAVKSRDWGRAAESLSPTVIENVFKAERMATEGATNIRGHKLYTKTGEQLKLTGGESVLQTLGFRPVRIGELATATRVAENVRQFYQKKREGLSSRVKSMGNDADKLRGIIEAVNRYNREVAKYGGAVPLITEESMEDYMKGRGPNKLLMMLGR